MGNVFDQFDAAPQAATAPPPTGGNVFDQFDAAGSPPQASGPSSLDPDYYERIAKLESGGNPKAYNKNSQAAGLYQIIPSTAKAYGVTDPYDVGQSQTFIHKFTGDNLSQLTQSLGRPPTSAEAYLAHMQGSGGASKLLSNPDAKAVDIVGKDAVLWNGGSSDMSAADFAKMVENKYAATDPNSMGNSAAGFANRALEPYSGMTTFRGGRGAAGPGAPRFVNGHGPAQQAVKDFAVGMAHGGIDVPLNSLASGASWIGKQLGYGGAYDATQAFNDKYNQDYAANSAGNSTAGTMGNLAGGIGTAALTPELGLFKGAGYLPTIAKGMLGGGIYGAEQNSASKNGLLQDVGVNAALGGVAAPIAKLAGTGLGALYSKFAGRGANAIGDLPAAGAGELSARNGEVLPPNRASDGLDTQAMAARRARFESLGMKPTRANITQEPSHYTIENNIQKQPENPLGQELTQRYQENSAALKAAIDQVHAGTGATATSLPEAGRDVATAFQSKMREMQSNNVSPAYKAVVKPENMLAPDQFTAMKQDNPLIQGAIDAVRQDKVVGSSIAGMPDSSLPVLDLAKQHLDDIEGAAMRSGEGNRARIAGNASRDLAEKLDAAFPGYADARAAAAERFHEFETPGMHSLQKGKIAPEDVITRIAHGGKLADVEALVKSLTTGTPQQVARGQAALNEVRGQTVDKLIAGGFGEDGKGIYSPKGFNTAFKKINGEGRMKILMTPEQLRAINEIKMAGKDAFGVVPLSSVNNSHTSTFMADKVGKFLRGTGGAVKSADEGLLGFGLSFIPGVSPIVKGVGMAAPTMEKFGEKSLARTVLEPNLEAAVAAHARAVASEPVRKLLAKLPISRAAVAITEQRRNAQGSSE